jgi:hypothetical protein
MNRMLRRWVLSLSLGLGMVAIPAAINAADDDKKTEKPAEPAAPTIPSKLPDFSKDYANSGELSGVVVAGDAESVIIQLKYRVPSGRGTREETKNLTFRYAEGALARTKVHPVRPDAKGKMVKVPNSEVEPRKKPTGAPGLHLDRTELKGGDIVTLQLLRPKSISEKNAVLEDKLIKMAIVTGETTPPKLTRDQSDAIKNKKKADADKEKEKKDDEKKKQ